MAHRSNRTRQPRRWLQAGALAAGLGAAYVTGSGVAHADDTGSSARTHASSGDSKAAGVGHSARTAPAKRAQVAAARDNSAPPGAEPVAKAGAGTRSSTVTLGADTTRQVPAIAAATESAPQPAAFAAAPALAAAAAPAPPAPVAPVYPAVLTKPVTVRAIVTDVLKWSGLPTLPYNPVPAAPVPDLLGGLWIGVRKVHYHLANSNPRASYTQGPQDPDTGEITGRIIGRDADGDQLTYTVADGPDHGQVTVNADGTYTYKPDAGYAHDGGPDTFTVAVSDDNAANPQHLHGLADLFGLDRPTTVTVNLRIAAINKAPVVSKPTTSLTFYPKENPAVSGTVGATDPESDPLTYTVSTQGAHGTATVDADGKYTYTYTDSTDAAATVSDDTFVVTVSDGRGGQATQTVTTIAKVNQVPVVSQPTVTFTFYPAQFPSVSGTVEATDPDGDPLTYTVKTQPTYGTVDIDADGNYTYTSTDVFTEAFTVTVSDGRGGEATQTIQVNKLILAEITETELLSITLPSTAGDSVLSYITPTDSGSASQITLIGAANFNAWQISMSRDGKTVNVRPRVGFPKTFSVNFGDLVEVKQDNSGTYGLFANSSLIILFDRAAWG